MNPDSLRNRSNRFHVSHLPAKDFYSQGLHWGRQLSATTVIRFLRGDKMHTYESLFNEFAAAFQFPYYFGNNWPAFDECMADLEWMPGESYLLMFTQAESIYEDERRPEYPTLLKIISKISADWAKPISAGAAVRPGKPFHCVFQCDGSHRIEEQLKMASIGFDLL